MIPNYIFWIIRKNVVSMLYTNKKKVWMKENHFVKKRKNGLGAYPNDHSWLDLSS